MHGRLTSNPWTLGLIVGIVFGSADLLSTWLYPLEDDSPWVLLRFYGPMFLVWILVSFHAAWHTGRLSSGVTAGMAVAFATICVFVLFNFIRVNLFLNTLTGRTDWQNMMLRFRASGAKSLRLFVNLDYIKGTPFKIGVATAFGAALGTFGGLLGRLTRGLRIGTSLAAERTCMRTKPPVWAESLLRLFLRPDVFASVSGDLLEEYRDSIFPARGLMRSDRWYLTQVLGFVLRKSLPWAALFAGAFLARGVFDVLRPTADFHARSQVSTAIAVALLLASGFSIAWRSGSFFAGAAAGFATTATACVLSIAGNAVLLAFWHDPRVMSAVAASGGLDEAFTLPAMLIPPGIALAGIGGFVGAGTKQFSRSA